MEAMRVKVAEDGTLVIPSEIVEALGLLPQQTVTVSKRKEGILLQASRRERFERIGQLLRSALKGVDWKEIEAGRIGRCF